MLLTAKYVIPITSPYIEDGAVLVRDDKVLDLGTASQLKDKYPMEEVRDFGLSVLMPGFIDVHTHLGYTALRGMFGDLPYAEWKRRVLHTEPFFTEEDWIDSARVGALEAVASGITTIADISASGVSLVPAKEMGLRALWVSRTRSGRSSRASRQTSSPSICIIRTRTPRPIRRVPLSTRPTRTTSR